MFYSLTKLKFTPECSFIMAEKRIILNSFSLSRTCCPSLELSILKSNLITRGFEIDIIYWNLILDSELKILAKMFPLIDSAVINLLPFIHSLVKTSEDHEALERIKTLLYYSAPDMRFKGSQHSLSILDDISNRIEVIVDKTLNKVCSSNTFMFSCFNNDIPPQIYQWIPALILIEKVKTQFPEIYTVCGSFLTSNAAEIFMSISKDCDFSIWGKTDKDSIDKMCENYIDLETQIVNIPNIIYKNNDVIIHTASKFGYSDSDDINKPTFDDFVKQSIDFSKQKIFFPISASNGCSWNKCKFCYYKMPSKYKQREENHIIDEIKEYQMLYGADNFMFVDNDIIGENKKFEKLLDSLIKLSFIKPINLYAELIPFNLTAETIKKIVFAGFKKIEIGYESISDNLLLKMNKKNSFSDNIHFVKFARKYNLNISGCINLITEIPDETEADVIESINNLHFLRFFLKDNIFYHKFSQLGIIKGTRYFNLISPEEKPYWNKNKILYLMPEKFKQEEIFSNLFVCHREFHKNKTEWEKFIEIEKYYRTADYSYKIINFNGIPYFKEYLNHELIISIGFDNPLYIDILKSTNEKVCSLNELIENLRIKYNGKQVEENKIIRILNELKHEYLVYSDTKFDKIISIIDITMTENC